MYSMRAQDGYTYMVAICHPLGASLSGAMRRGNSSLHNYNTIPIYLYVLYRVHISRYIIILLHRNNIIYIVLLIQQFHLLFLIPVKTYNNVLNDL